MAGIAGGIGEHLGIDPVLPRVAFVVLTVFGGLGILLYLICWLLMPDEGERMSPAETLLGRGSRSRSVFAGDTVLAAIIAVVLALYLSRHHGTDYVLLALVLGIGFVTYRHLERPQPPTGPGAPPPQPQPTPYATWRPTADDPPPGGMGAARLRPGWDTPTKSPREAGPRLTVVAFCLALILAGLLVALDHTFGLGLSPRTVLALLLALIGTALVVGAWWGRARGLILLGIPLAVVLMAAGDPLLEDWGAHDQIWAPTSVSEISPVYRLSAGRGVLDLRNVDLANANRQITVQMGAGDLRVKLPPDVDVRARGEVTMGSMTVLGSGASGVNQHRVVTDDGPDGPGDGRLRIWAYLSFGHLEVIR